MEEIKIKNIVKAIVIASVVIPNGFGIYVLLEPFVANGITGIFGDHQLSSWVSIFFQCLALTCGWALLLIGLVGFLIMPISYHFASHLLNYNLDIKVKDKIKNYNFRLTCRLVLFCSIIIQLLLTLAFMNK